MPGPTTKDTSSLALGLAQMRIGASADSIADIHPALSASDSIGSLADSKFLGSREYFTHESGFPLLEDHIIAIREGARVEGTYEELNPYNLALSWGLDPTSGDYALAHSGEIKLGALTSPAYLRSELHYTFPETDYTLDAIFPRAQVTGDAELGFQKEAPVGSPIVLTAKRADSGIADGNAVWDAMPIGRLAFYDAS